jgi:hypothetical protein
VPDLKYGQKIDVEKLIKIQGSADRAGNSKERNREDSERLQRSSVFVAGAVNP